MEIGRIVGFVIDRNRDAETATLQLEIEISDDQDVQTVDLFSQAGEDYTPPKDSRVVTLALGEAFKVAVAVNDGQEPQTEEGEREMYSLAGGERKAKIRLLTDGVVRINDGDDFAVRFSELKKTIDEIRADMNDFQIKYNALVLPISGGSAGPPPPPSIVTPSTFTVDAAKVDDIKVP